MAPALTIALCGVPERLKAFSTFEHLCAQAEPFGDQVQVLYLVDNYSMTVGEKRTALVGLARGEYVAFVDDDDRVSIDYVAQLLKAAESGASVLTFLAEVRMDGGPRKPCHYSLRWREDSEDAQRYYRTPNHLNAWRKELIMPYAAKNFGEDADWAKRMRAHKGLTEHHIARTLYFYDFNSAVTRTRGGAR